MNPLQVARVVVGGLRLVKDPSKLEEVFAMADGLTDPKTMAIIRDAFAAVPEGAKGLRERPRMGRVDLATLRTLPEGTLGKSFATFLDRHGLDPSSLPYVEANNEMDWIRAHLYETHDVWHVLTGFEPDVAGELGLQAFYLAQFPARLAAAILTVGMLNTLLFGFDDRNARMNAIIRGWLLGRRAKSFLGARWGEMWALPLSEVRARFNLQLESVESVLPALVDEKDGVVPAVIAAQVRAAA